MGSYFDSPNNAGLSEITFHAGTNLTPSSSKAECFALLTALLVCPTSSSITISTDSANTIATYHTIMNPLTSERKILKTNNHCIWRLIKHIILTQHLQVRLLKIKAHSGNLYNDMADAEAKKGLLLPQFTLIHKLFRYFSYTNLGFYRTHRSGY